MDLLSSKQIAVPDSNGLSKKPVDSIIRQLKYLLSSGQLLPGDRLLSERKLAEKFGVGRAHVREAIKKLEFYGFLKTLPQSGTFVAGLDVSALEDLISDALKIEIYDFYSLVETRLILEINAVKLCCRRCTGEDLKLIEQSLLICDQKIKEGSAAVDEDLNFHLQIAEASKNQVLKSMMLIITPDIMTNYRKYWMRDKSESVVNIEHGMIFEYIKKRNVHGAEKMMTQHLKGVMDFARKQEQFDKLNLS